MSTVEGAVYVCWSRIVCSTRGAAIVHVLLVQTLCLFRVVASVFKETAHTAKGMYTTPKRKAQQLCHIKGVNLKGSCY